MQSGLRHMCPDSASRSQRGIDDLQRAARLATSNYRHCSSGLHRTTHIAAHQPSHHGASRGSQQRRKGPVNSGGCIWFSASHAWRRRGEKPPPKFLLAKASTHNPLSIEKPTPLSTVVLDFECREFSWGVCRFDLSVSICYGVSTNLPPVDGCCTLDVISSHPHHPPQTNSPRNPAYGGTPAGQASSKRKAVPPPIAWISGCQYRLRGSNRHLLHPTEPTKTPCKRLRTGV